VKAAAAVVFLTAIPLSALMIGAGTMDRRPSEVAAGLLVGALIGVPLLIAALRERDRPAD
jgi:hypothetical protein